MNDPDYEPGEMKSIRRANVGIVMVNKPKNEEVATINTDNFVKGELKESHKEYSFIPSHSEKPLGEDSNISISQKAKTPTEAESSRFKGKEEKKRKAPKESYCFNIK
mgnify:CR=1 FL=1